MKSGRDIRTEENGFDIPFLKIRGTMLGERQGKRWNKYVPDYVVFDLETTGISYKTDKIIEISAVKVLSSEAAEEFTSFVNPKCHIPYGASRVNGITDEMVAGALPIEDVLPKFLEFIGDFVLVGHNIHSFDLKFLDRDCMALYGRTVANDYIDTLMLARTCLPRLLGHKLTDLASHYGISTRGAHRALNDCRMNQQVFERLGTELKQHADTITLCPKCGSTMVVRNGKYGRFSGCCGYPNCRYTQNIREA